MKKIATHAPVFTLAAIFLMSFTGVRLLIHHCLSCETTDIALFSLASDDLHHRHAEAATCHIDFGDEGHSSCCPVNHGDDHEHSCENCCKTEIHYLKNDYEMQAERNEKRIEAPVLAVLFHFVAPHITNELPSKRAEHYFTDSGPPTPVGRDFVIYAQHLKIAC